MAIPVPVPKQSLFKSKAKAIGKAMETIIATGKAEAIDLPKSILDLPKEKPPIDLLPKMPVAPQAVVTSDEAAAFLKASTPSTIDVAIPAQLYHMILSKPSTGGGWQSIMAQLQSGLAYQGSGSATTHLLHLSPWLLAKIVDKATIGSGGYQAVMRWVVCLAAKQHPGKIIAGKGE